MPPRHHRQSGLSIATWPTLLSATAQALTVGAVLAGCRLFTALGERAATCRAGATRTGLSSGPCAGSLLVPAMQALRRGAGPGSDEGSRRTAR